MALVLALSEVSVSGLRNEPRLLAPMPGSLVEAALTRDVPEVTLRLALGESPSRRARVRLRTGVVVQMDALDAAVLSGSVLVRSAIYTPPFDGTNVFGGPNPTRLGATPAVAYPTNRASGVRPRSLARSVCAAPLIAMGRVCMISAIASR